MSLWRPRRPAARISFLLPRTSRGKAAPSASDSATRAGSPTQRGSHASGGFYLFRITPAHACLREQLPAFSNQSDKVVLRTLACKVVRPLQPASHLSIYISGSGQLYFDVPPIRRRLFPLSNPGTGDVAGRLQRQNQLRVAGSYPSERCLAYEVDRRLLRLLADRAESSRGFDNRGVGGSHGRRAIGEMLSHCERRFLRHQTLPNRDGRTRFISLHILHGTDAGINSDPRC